MLDHFLALRPFCSGVRRQRIMYMRSFHVVLAGFVCLPGAARQSHEANAQDAGFVLQAAEPAVAVVEAAAEPAAPEQAPAKEAARGEAGEEEAKERPAVNARKAAVAGGLVEVAREMAQALRLVAPQRAAPIVQDVQLAQVDALTGQLRKLLIAEVSFAKRVCELNADEEAAAVAAAKGAGKKFAQDYLQANGQMNGGIVIFANGGGGVRQADPVSQLQTAVAEAIGGTLPEEKRGPYQEEVALRDEFRQQASAESLTALIDERLLLSDEQRTKITQSLAESAEDHGLPPLETMMHMGSSYLPSMPEEAITPHLDDGQKQLWNQVQKISYGMSFDGNHNPITGGTAIDDVDFGDE